MLNRNLVVTPNCCKQIQQFAAVKLCYLNRPYQDDYYDNAKYLDDKPKWCVKVFNEEQLRNKDNYYSYFEVCNCPFCGKKLPDIKLRTTTKRICKITDGGYYCDTCKQRLNCCSCAPMEYMWEPV